MVAAGTDAQEQEEDVKLQKDSKELLAEFTTSLPKFAWRQTSGHGNAQQKPRSYVDTRETDRLVLLLEPFQELPQLLDPHLQELIPALAHILLVCLQLNPSSEEPKSISRATNQRLIPLQRAICKILYTFCKIRGPKVIVRFLSTETKYIELLLSTIEAGVPADNEGPNEESNEEPVVQTSGWSWEERYIVLLWLSHLLLAPFSLASISSTNSTESKGQAIAGLSWSGNVPVLTRRVIALATRYLTVSSKDREAATVLLVRIAMRKDMQQLGVLDSLVKWALSQLCASSPGTSSYHSIGILSFLAGLLSSSVSTMDMDSYAYNILLLVQEISTSESAFCKEIRSSAVARKLVIKIIRTIAVLYLQNEQANSAEVVESAIGHMFDVISDPATPVRVAASKSLSVITMKLSPEFATQIVEEALGALSQNTSTKKCDSVTMRTRLDFSRVNAMEWHGLILTISHLTFRHSSPKSTLSDIVPTLIHALSFEQRSTSGHSTGINVRDAACYGLWSLVRRYSTEELLAIPAPASSASSAMTGSFAIADDSVIKSVARELIVSACLDPSGNIRRGSSAALQELIGRHPDIVEEGIALIQVIDYHAVAVRTRAMKDVVLAASKLSLSYAHALISGLLDWRGIGDSDDSVRRLAATVIGQLVAGPSLYGGHVQWSWFNEIIADLESIEIQSGSKIRAVEERQGRILSLAQIIKTLRPVMKKPSRDNIESIVPPTIDVDQPTITHLRVLLQEILTDPSLLQNVAARRQELIAEAVSQLINATYPMPVTDAIQAYVKGKSVRFLTEGLLGAAEISASDDVYDQQAHIKNLFQASTTTWLPHLDTAKALVEKWLARNEKEVMDAASEAAAGLLFLLDDTSRQAWIKSWATIVSKETPGRSGQNLGYLYAIFNAYPLAGELKQSINDAIHTRWRSTYDVDVRVTVLQRLACSDVLDTDAAAFSDLISEGLDDYTTDTRGDIGSLVRVEALNAADRMWQNSSSNEGLFRSICGKIIRLAAEKMDKVRTEAQKTTLRLCSQGSEFGQFSSSSREYFSFLLHLHTDDHRSSVPFESSWLVDMLEGYVGSADTGSEDLLRASRAALADFCDENADLVSSAMWEVLKRNEKNDRVLVPALEVMSFLFDIGAAQKTQLNWFNLYALLTRAHYQTGNVRKVEACIKVYGGLVEVYPKVLQKLTSLLGHPWPRIRNQAADTLFVVRGVGKGISWNNPPKVNKQNIEVLRKELQI
ncbi:hypothetical protein BP6252_04082 [Coleophoma cylindrospora]|uniref:Uncharacterized protein n=1 Tax=Coleophoma cylindrospora TaxID=1849047 RepID=A0A3D8S020_9HELO|nr:hypothetical protein BP6252_04082 [Coleophoma cylindrospora]